MTIVIFQFRERLAAVEVGEMEDGEAVGNRKLMVGESARGGPFENRNG